MKYTIKELKALTFKLKLGRGFPSMHRIVDKDREKLDDIDKILDWYEEQVKKQNE